MVYTQQGLAHPLVLELRLIWRLMTIGNKHFFLINEAFAIIKAFCFIDSVHRAFLYFAEAMDKP